MAKRKQEQDEAGNDIPLAELPALPPLDTEEEIQLAIAELADVKARKKQLEADEEQRERQLLDSLFALGLVDYTIPDVVKVVAQTKTTRTIDRAKLIGLGVDPDKVDEATNTSVSAPFLRFYPKKAS